MTDRQSQLEEFKRLAALEAVKHVKSGMTVGLGTGSTAKYAILEIGRLIQDGKLAEIIGVPTSQASEDLARSVGINVQELTAFGVDVAIDGADEIDPNLDLIKGHGGALVREKVVEFHARFFVVVADTSKLVPELCSKVTLPVEILAWGSRATVNTLAGLQNGAQVRLRTKEGQAVVSDNGNLIADMSFRFPVTDVREMDARIRHTPGVVDTGFFLGYANIAYVAGPGGVETFKR
jgi:ribose 5-phosphate isomerase A